MILFLLAQDINSLEVGLLEENGRLFSFQKFITTPEKFLFNVSGFLNEQKVAIEDLKKIVVVSGPGSFTSTRMIVTITNALAWAKNLPIVGVENSERKSGEELIALLTQDWLIKNSTNFISPFYDRPPNITLKNSKF